MQIYNLKDSDFICYCIEVNKKTIINSIKRGNITLQNIKNDIKACTGSQCKKKNPSGKCCSKDIKKLIRLVTTKVDNTTCSCCQN